MEKCPKCGSKAELTDGISVRFECDTMLAVRSGSVSESKECLRRQLAAANERAGRLEKALIEWEGDWFTGGKTKIVADNRLRELLIEMRIIDRILGGA